MDKLMNKIVCPECGTEIELDDEKYSRIVAQVRTEQFEKEVLDQVNAVKEQQEAKQQKLLADTKTRYTMDLAEKEKEIARLLEQVKNADTAQKQEVEAVKMQAVIRHREELEEKERLILELQAKAETADKDKQIAISAAVEAVKKENMELRVQIEQEKRSADAREHELKESHKWEVNQMKEQIEFYKDLKIRQSTKMLGETLEQHCMTVFRQHRDEFPNAVFDKDNTAVEGTKGDFVLKEVTDDGIEVVSIMFEMKNEADATVKKHKNEEFLDKLDKDRQKKKCEYAVLVTTLEPDDEVYNEGIVAAHQYDKMFIIRPQFFLTIIRVLRKAALASIDARRELMTIQRENLDIQKFDEKIFDIRDKFEKHYGMAQGHFNKVIKEIDDAIKKLEAIKESLGKTGYQLSQANNRLQDLTIKKLTKGNIGMQQKFLAAGIPIE